MHNIFFIEDRVDAYEYTIRPDKEIIKLSVVFDDKKI